VDIGINQLQQTELCLRFATWQLPYLVAVVAAKMKMEPADVMKDWLSGVLPGIQVVPSGVWAVGRGQEHGSHIYLPDKSGIKKITLISM